MQKFWVSSSKNDLVMATAQKMAPPPPPAPPVTLSSMELRTSCQLNIRCRTNNLPFLRLCSGMELNLIG